MKKVMRILAVLLALALVFSACSPSQKAEEETTSPVVEEEAVSEEEGEAEHEPVELVYWHAGPIQPLEPVTLQRVAEFEEQYPWIDVTVEGFSFFDYFTKLDTATSAGTMADVFWVDHTEIPRYSFFETILPLSDYVSVDYIDDFFDTPQEDMAYKGEIWAIPLHQSTEAMFYNKEYIEAADLNPPKSYDEAWTLEEFRDALEKVTQVRDDGTTEVWGWMTNYSISVYNWQPWIEMQGGQLMDPELTTFIGYLDSEETIAAADYVAQLHLDGLAPVERVPDMFQTGKVAFLQSNPFALVDIQNRYPDLDIGVMPMPCDVNCAVNSGAWHLGISSQTEHPEEAWLFVDFMTNFEGHKAWVEGTGYMPARISVYEDIPEMKEYPLNIFMDGLTNYAVHRPRTIAYQFFNRIMSTAINDFNLGADIEKTMPKIAEQAQEELDSYK